MLILDGKKKQQEKKEERQVEKFRKEKNMKFTDGRIPGFKFKGSLQVRKG